MKAKAQVVQKSVRGVVSDNKRARFDVAVEDSMEAGLVLTGDEIKSIRAGRAEISGAYIKLLYGGRNSNLGQRGESAVLPEVVLVGAHFQLAAVPDRSRKLLLHKKQITEIAEQLNEKGSTVVPLKLLLKHGYAKLEIGVGKGRKKYDKRELLKQRDLDRETNLEFKKGQQWSR